jgi:hypothetical protein
MNSRALGGRWERSPPSACWHCARRHDREHRLLYPRIEGSKLSNREVERLLTNLEIKSFASRDEQEVAGYAEAMELVFRSWDDIAITENHIKQLHRDLLVHSEKDERHRGNYKTGPQQRRRLRRERPADRHRL